MLLKYIFVFIVLFDKIYNLFWNLWKLSTLYVHLLVIAWERRKKWREIFCSDVLCSCSFWLLYFHVCYSWLTVSVTHEKNPSQDNFLKSGPTYLWYVKSYWSSHSCLFKTAPTCSQIICICKHARIDCQREQVKAKKVVHGLWYSLFNSFNWFSLHFGTSCVLWTSKLLD